MVGLVFSKSHEYRPEKSRTMYLNVPRPRLRVRRVDEVALAEKLRQRAINTGEWQYEVIHGGVVANACRNPAFTEAALAVANPSGLVAVWMAKLSALHVTLSGSANACLAGSRALWDLRSRQRARDLTIELLKSSHRALFPKTCFERLLREDDF